MDKDAGNNEQSGKVKTVGGYIAAAIDIEERLSVGVYNDYLKREMWPAELKQETFDTIKNHLMTLIKDTARHKKILSDLEKLYDENTQ